jgi:tRNA (guanine26-N2/guanine27-N2)-dimethyltransferase
LDKSGGVRDHALVKNTGTDGTEGKEDAHMPLDLNGKVNEEKREIVFDESLGKERDAKKLVRYQQNPRENWGPMNRAKGY